MFESLFIIKINTSFNMEGKSQTMHLSAFRKNKNKILRGHPSSGQYGTIQSEQNQGRQKKIYIYQRERFDQLNNKMDFLNQLNSFFIFLFLATRSKFSFSGKTIKYLFDEEEENIESINGANRLIL